jgi:hypothetical protein
MVDCLAIELAVQSGSNCEVVTCAYGNNVCVLLDKVGKYFVHCVL